MMPKADWQVSRRARWLMVPVAIGLFGIALGSCALAPTPGAPNLTDLADRVGAAVAGLPGIEPTAGSGTAGPAMEATATAFPTPSPQPDSEPATAAGEGGDPTPTPEAETVVLPTATVPSPSPTATPTEITRATPEATPEAQSEAGVTAVITDTEATEAGELTGRAGDPEAAVGLTAITVPELLNARSGPGTQYEIVDRLEQATAVTALAVFTDTDRGETWLLAQAAGIDRPLWIFGDLVQIQGQLRDLPPAADGQLPPTPAPSPTPDYPALRTAQALNVRQGPGTDYPVISAARADTFYAVTGRNEAGDWWQIRIRDEDRGWVYAPLTTAQGDLTDVAAVADIPPPPPPNPVAAVSPAAAPPAPAPTGGGGFGYGVQAHMVHTGQEGQVMGHVGNLGFNWVKQQVEWKLFERNQGQIDLGALHPIVNAANGAGVNLLFSVVNAPDWAREPGFDGGVGGPPQDPGTFANFLGRLAGDFCGSSLKAIEVWNEQNLHYEWGNRPLSPGEYLNLLRPAYARIKQACPSMKVISGALTPAGDNGNLAMDDYRYLEGMLQNGLGRYADGIGAHPSGYNVPPSVRHEQACQVIQTTGNSFNGACDTPHHSWSFRSTLEGYRSLAVRYGAGNLLIWPTEFGWAAGGAFDPRYMYANDNSFEEQAQWTVEAFTLMRNWGWVGPAFLWNLNFRVVADGTEKAQWGIVRNDWSPLPVYDALRAMPK